MESVADRHLAIVIEPTAAIMREQVAKLSAKSVSSTTSRTMVSLKRPVVEDKIKFVYIF